MRRRRLSPTLLALAVAAAATAAAPAAAATITKGPYLQQVGPTEATVVWFTDEPTPATLTVGTRALAVPAAAAGAPQVATMKSLEPNTRYDYAVALGDTTVATGSLATAPSVGSDEPFTFLVYGDTRSNPSAHAALVAAMTKEAPDFVLIVGDLVASGANDADWVSFFAIERDFLRDHPVWPVIGNHDLASGSGDAFRAHFALPEDGWDPERAYAFRHGNALFVALDGNQASSEAQRDWLAETLEAADRDRVRHVFVFSHHPVYSTALHGGTPALQALWAPLFERHRITASFAGHDHHYERLVKDGLTYFVSGGGGANLYQQSPMAADLAWSVTQESAPHYLRVRVRGGAAEVTAIRVDGTVIESTTLERPLPLRPTPARDDGGGCRVAGASGAGSDRTTGALALAAVALPFMLGRLRTRARLGRRRVGSRR